MTRLKFILRDIKQANHSDGTQQILVAFHTSNCKLNLKWKHFSTGMRIRRSSCQLRLTFSPVHRVMPCQVRFTTLLSPSGRSKLTKSKIAATASISISDHHWPYENTPAFLELTQRQSKVKLAALTTTVEASSPLASTLT